MMAANLPVLLAGPYLFEGAASPDQLLSSLFHSQPPGASPSPGKEETEMRDGKIKD